MKNIVSLFIAVLSLLVVSCLSSNVIPEVRNLEKKLNGSWVIDSKDGVASLPNDYFIMEFNGVTTQGYGTRVVDGENSSWYHRDSPYTVDDDVITISDDRLLLILHVLEIDDYFSFEVVTYTYDGVDQMDTSIYSGRKLGDEYSSIIVGEWQGADKTYIGTSEEEANTHRWFIHSYGTFEYKSYNSKTGEWETQEEEEEPDYEYNGDQDADDETDKVDTYSYFYLYGNILIFDFYNNQLTGVDGRCCELWEITINSTSNPVTMVWRAEREDGSIAEFYLEKID